MEDKLFSVRDKICIVTGGVGQLGVNYAKELFSRGAKVSVWSRSVPKERIMQHFTQQELDTGRLSFYPVDINVKNSIEAALDGMERDWSDVPDVLINNLVGTFLACQAVGARMVKAGKGGSIINVGSIYGMLSPVQDIYAYKEEMTGVPFVKPVAYSAAKSGIYNLTRYLATYWGKKGIRVNTFTPSGVWRDTQDEYFQANYCARIPIGRMAREDEYNGAIVFLASDASRYMTGANLVMDGGWTAW